MCEQRAASMSVAHEGEGVGLCDGCNAGDGGQPFAEADVYVGKKMCVMFSLRLFYVV